jgi:hypothetical protein
MDLITDSVTPDEVDRIEVEISWLTDQALRRAGNAGS